MCQLVKCVEFEIGPHVASLVHTEPWVRVDTVKLTRAVRRRDHNGMVYSSNSNGHQNLISGSGE